MTVEKRQCPNCERNYPLGDGAFEAGAVLCVSCVDKEHALRVTMREGIARDHEQIATLALAKRDEQVVEMIDRLVNAPAETTGAPNLEQLWEDMSRAFRGTAGLAVETLSLYRCAKETTKQKLLQLVFTLGVKANEGGNLNKPTGEMTTEQLEATMIKLIEKKKQQQAIAAGILALEEANADD